MPSPHRKASVAIIGAGITGISTAYHLIADHHQQDVVIIDAGQPMAFTSAQSGENYRNWWPHPTMVAFTNRSIDLMERVARDSANQINMNRRGYALATRETNIDELLGQLSFGLGEDADTMVRFHNQPTGTAYRSPILPDWESAPDGVDVLSDRQLISEVFPSFDADVRTVIHIRRGGDISGQQLGTYMLDKFRTAGGRRIVGAVEEIEQRGSYSLTLRTAEGVTQIDADKIVNAAGPFASNIGKMLGIKLPVQNVFQQKIAFEDTQKTIPRNMPFSIDLDQQTIDWSEEDREVLREDPTHAWLTEEMPGAIHCRPDGGDTGTWVKLGWAYNDRPALATWEPPLADQFPEVVLRGAARLNPTLKQYYNKLPRGMHHYGGWYTMTEENWPLIGPMGPEGAFMNCAHSGFGTMDACASGELCAAWVANAALPDFANHLSLDRYEDTQLMAVLEESNRGVL